MYTLGGENLRTRDNDDKLTPETDKASSYTGCTGKTMKDDSDILMTNNIIRDLGYNGVGDKQSNRKIYFTLTLPKLVEESQNKSFDENTDDSDKLQGEGVKIIIPSNIIDIYTRLEVLLELKLSVHTNTQTEASNLIDDLSRRGEIQNEQPYGNPLEKFSTILMDLPSKLFEQISFNTKLKLEEDMLIFMDTSTHEKHIFQALQTKKKQLKMAMTFLIGYNGIFNVKVSNKKFHFKKSKTDEDHFNQHFISPGAYEIESLDNETKRIVVGEEHFTESYYPFQIKATFSTLGSFIGISPQGPIISFVFADGIRNLLVF